MNEFLRGLEGKADLKKLVAITRIHGNIITAKYYCLTFTYFLVFCFLPSHLNISTEVHVCT